MSNLDQESQGNSNLGLGLGLASIAGAAVGIVALILKSKDKGDPLNKPDAFKGVIAAAGTQTSLGQTLSACWSRDVESLDAYFAGEEAAVGTLDAQTIAAYCIFETLQNRQTLISDVASRRIVRAISNLAVDNASSLGKVLTRHRKYSGNAISVASVFYRTDGAILIVANPVAFFHICDNRSRAASYKPKLSGGAQWNTYYQLQDEVAKAQWLIDNVSVDEDKFYSTDENQVCAYVKLKGPSYRSVLDDWLDSQYLGIPLLWPEACFHANGASTSWNDAFVGALLCNALQFIYDHPSDDDAASGLTLEQLGGKLAACTRRSRLDGWRTVDGVQISDDSDLASVPSNQRNKSHFSLMEFSATLDMTVPKNGYDYRVQFVIKPAILSNTIDDTLWNVRMLVSGVEVYSSPCVLPTLKLSDTAWQPCVSIRNHLANFIGL